MTNAVFAGSFDPPTNGHLDIIERASKLCDKLDVVKNKSVFNFFYNHFFMIRFIISALSVLILTM